MRKLLSTRLSGSAFNLAMLVLRVGVATLMIPHGYDKLMKFAEYKNKFVNFLGLGGATSLALVIFAEFFCAIFILMGLFTRFATIPLIISTAMATFKAHNGDIFGKGELTMLFLIAFITILIAGPGKISVDGAIWK